MSHEYYNIVIGGEGLRRRSNGINAEKIKFFNNFVRVSKGLLSTIVAGTCQCPANETVPRGTQIALLLLLLLLFCVGVS